MSTPDLLQPFERCPLCGHLGRQHYHLPESGLPPDFDLPGFTARAKVKAIGNGVPLAMGRAVVRAVRQAVYTDGAR